MKRKLFLLPIAAAALLFSCNAIEEPASESGDGKAVVVNFSLGTATRATSGISDDAVNTAYVFAFDGDRLDGSASATGKSGSISVTPGSRTFIAVVNPNSEFSFTGVSSPDDVMSLVSSLESEGLADMVMVGSSTAAITASTTSVTIPVTRLVSKISVNSLKFDLTGALEGKSVSDVAIYVKNYPTTESYSGVEGTAYTSGLYAARQSTFEVYDQIGTMADGAAVTGHHFFCYPRKTTLNVSGSKAIRLCVTGTIDGQKYYWSLPVNNGTFWDSLAFTTGDEHFGVMRNHSYEYSITITRAGVPDDGSSPDPTRPEDQGKDDLEDDEDLSTSELTFTLNVIPFVEVAEQEISF